MIIEWIDPKTVTPPFGVQILVMLGGHGSNDAGRTFERYVKIMNAVISNRSPNDDEDGDEKEAYLAGPKDDYDQYQWMVYPFDEWKYGLGDEEDSDWFTDSIIRWAFMPVTSEYFDE